MRERRFDRGLVALLRLLSGGAAALEEGDGAGQAASPLVLVRSDGARRAVEPAVLKEAVSRGLARREDGRLAATREGLAFLRRSLAAAGGPDDESFAAQHRTLTSRPLVEAGQVTTVRVNLAESPLAVVARLKDKEGAAFLSAEAIAAGERLHRDFTRGQMQPRLIMAYAPRLETPMGGAGAEGGTMSDSALAARARVGRAVEALGPELSGIALDICCFEKGLECVERERQWPARSAKLLLRAALMALARHYAPPSRPARRSHVWSEAADLRPPSAAAAEGLRRGGPRPRPGSA